MPENVDNPLASLLKHTTALRGLEATVIRINEGLDTLATQKATRSELDGIANRLQDLQSRVNIIEAQARNLSNRHDEMMHTAFRVDPESVLPLLEPLKERLEWLEQMSGDSADAINVGERKALLDVVDGLKNTGNRIVDLEHRYEKPGA